LLMVEEEDKERMREEVAAREQELEHMQKKLSFVQDALSVEEDAKRSMLLRYIHAAKEAAMSSKDGAGGVLQLPESNVTDEEVHALAAMLQNNTSIDELNLRGNNITDEGARALAAVLSGVSGLRLIDLRGNKIGKGAIRVLGEALERAERVKHVYVHAGGKIEALGSGHWGRGGGGASSQISTDKEDSDADVRGLVTVETVCVVDVRENNPATVSSSFELNTSSVVSEFTSHKDNGHHRHSSGPPSRLQAPGSVTSAFTPVSMLQSVGAPPKSAVGGSRLDPVKEKKMKAAKLSKRKKAGAGTRREGSVEDYSMSDSVVDGRRGTVKVRGQYVAK